MKSNVHLLIVLTGNATATVKEKYGDFAQHFLQNIQSNLASGLVLQTATYSVHEEWPQKPLPDPAQFDGIIFSGSASMLDEQKPWMLATQAFMRDALDKRVPLLGVCFGHQLLAAAKGASVGPNPKGRSNGSRLVKVADPTDPLLKDMPSEFVVQVSHRDIVLKPSPELHVLANADHDLHQIIRAGDTAWGVQFHPEWDMEISRGYVEARRETLDRELGEGSAQKMLDTIKPSPEAGRLLQRFVEICRERE